MPFCVLLLICILMRTLSWRSLRSYVQNESPVVHVTGCWECKSQQLWGRVWSNWPTICRLRYPAERVRSGPRTCASYPPPGGSLCRLHDLKLESHDTEVMGRLPLPQAERLVKVCSFWILFLFFPPRKLFYPHNAGVSQSLICYRVMINLQFPIIRTLRSWKGQRGHEKELGLCLILVSRFQCLTQTFTPQPVLEFDTKLTYPFRWSLSPRPSNYLHERCKPCKYVIPIQSKRLQTNDRKVTIIRGKRKQSKSGIL